MKHTGWNTWFIVPYDAMMHGIQMVHAELQRTVQQLRHQPFNSFLISIFFWREDLLSKKLYLPFFQKKICCSYTKMFVSEKNKNLLQKMCEKPTLFHSANKFLAPSFAPHLLKNIIALCYIMNIEHNCILLHSEHWKFIM